MRARFLARRVLPASVALALASCMVGPDYERPTPEAPADWHDGDSAPRAAAPSDSVALESIAWAEIFGDADLKALIERALERNRDLQVALERVAQARAAATVAGAGRWPTVDLEQTSEREHQSALIEAEPDPAADELFLGPAIAWEIDLWGQQRRASRAAMARYLGAQYGAQAARLTLVAAVAQTCFELQGVRARMQISRDTVFAREQSLAIAERRFKGGLTSRLEVRQAEVNLAATRSALVRVQQQETLAEHRLSILLGEPPGSQALQGSLQQRYVPNGVTAGLPLQLLDRRPDLMAAEQDVVAASEDIGMATANLFPNIQLTGSAGIQSEDFSDLLDPDGEYWIVNLDIVMPLFNAGARRATVTAAEHRYNETRLAWEQAFLQALREVSDALVLFRRSGEQLEAELALEQASQGYLDLAFKRYRNGVLAYIDVLDAQRSLYAAQIAVSQAREARLTALVSLYRALGGGWTPAAAEPSR